jgi:hypothetical protein
MKNAFSYIQWKITMARMQDANMASLTARAVLLRRW